MGGQSSTMQASFQGLIHLQINVGVTDFQIQSLAKAMKPDNERLINSNKTSISSKLEDMTTKDVGASFDLLR
ncbi:hypothetical protein HS088_TW18G00500 [Tripterygium wilfordii]|uniref:Uncharacterized protein n=1 Tax=Tripterygium wilfordii TaxID=458696 RepID=A0A7J7CD04_TRIWF|nr:hypothetical protein HS088_TW18G00500 [Tripterygium wilfordii]